VRRTAAEIGAVAGLAHDAREPLGHRDVATEAQRHGRLAVCGSTQRGPGPGTGRDPPACPDLGSRAALTAFGPEGGDLINIASLSGLGPVPGLSVYAPTKAAVIPLALSLSWETPKRVHVRAVCP